MFAGGMRTRVFALACVALVGGCGERPLEPREPTPGTPHFRIVTYNLHFPEAGDARTLEAVAASNGDVVCLQEVTAEWEAALSRRFAEDYPHRLFRARPKAAGLGVLSRFPVADLGVLPAPSDWHPAWHLLVTAPVGPIQLLNVHLRAVFDGRGNPVRSYTATAEDHLTEIRSFSQVLMAGMPAVVLGDFNEGVDGAAIEYLERRGYTNALPLYHPGQATWRGRSVTGQLEMTIDHILFDVAFEPLNAYVIDGGGSDHLPVVARLEAAARSSESR
jgi:endonuclease/exonuclease/phosphatase family metal-dependent hydrolase